MGSRRPCETLLEGGERGTEIPVVVCIYTGSIPGSSRTYMYVLYSRYSCAKGGNTELRPRCSDK